MSTFNDIVDELAAYTEVKAPLRAHFDSMVDLLMCGDHEQHLTTIATDSSSAIYAVTPAVCTEPFCEPTLPCGECKFAQRFVLRVHNAKGMTHTTNTTIERGETTQGLPASVCSCSS
jgi:hypothetical protein